jgi:hypothetical protein
MFGNGPAEDEDVSDFATSFMKGFAHHLSKPKESPRLCDSCVSIPIKWLLESPSRGYILFHRAAELSESAKRCELCSLIHQSVEGLCDGDVRLINVLMAPQFLIVEMCRRQGIDYRVLRLCTDPGK